MSDNTRGSPEKGEQRSCQKRSISDDHNEQPLIKKSTFKLKSPMLIHGKQQISTSGGKCKFLQPSKLQPPSSSTFGSRVEKASTTSEDKSKPSLFSKKDNKPTFTNPFLVCTSDETEESDSTQVKTNDKDDHSKETAATEKPKDEKSEEKKDDKVKLLQSSSVTKSSFVFGQNLSERAKVEEDQNNEDKKNQQADSLPSFCTVDNTENEKSSEKSLKRDESASTNETKEESEEEIRKKLKENAAEHFAASQSKTIAPAVEAHTGEEDEKNVLQIQCKLYQYEQQQWKERGAGMLHLNDSNSDNFQSRLVMRTNGSMRVVLNTKVWAQMSVDKASKKSIRISAQTQTADIGVYLISGSVNDIEQVHRAIEYRVLHQKQNNNNGEDKQEQDATD